MRSRPRSSAAGVELAGFNLYSGDMPGGDRGFLNRPAERHDVLANAEDAIALAGRTGTRHQRARRRTRTAVTARPSSYEVVRRLGELARTRARAATSLFLLEPLNTSTARAI